MRFRFWRLALVAVSPLFVVLAYLLLAGLGGLVPASLNKVESQGRVLSQPVYLVSNMLHADIAIPVNSLSLQQFSFLRDAGLPLDNPALKYLVFGWGSKAFYTSTKDYSDIEIGTVWRAVTGDEAVMHVAPAGNLSGVEDLIALKVSEEGFARLVDFIAQDFKDGLTSPELIEGASFGFGDVFYEDEGYFHIFNPCNVWVSRALKEAGLASGLWTPTTYSLLINNYLYN